MSADQIRVELSATERTGIPRYTYLKRGRKQLVLDFGEAGANTVVARVGISTVSPEGAWKNLRAENLGRPFQEIRSAAARAWNGYLSRIVIDGTTGQKVTFYSSLCHLFIQPNNIADVDGRYRGADDQIQTRPKTHSLIRGRGWRGRWNSRVSPRRSVL